ncbi:Single-stranded-DNA-specific exonuclease RecJ [Chlamydiales bacterium SCGC AG-110-M15]|nr:Single-stranded-DNA-specific exonuclease RecJ [Chlamydiales bacterium SCGC AG-110-M15]
MSSSTDETICPLWIYPKVDVDLCEKIEQEFNIHPVSAQILVSRGFTSISDINRHLYSKLPDLHDPELMPDMPQAIDRICLAMERNEGILIYGDNDVDGMTGTALLTEFLSNLGAQVHFYVPNRNNLREELIIDALHFAKDNSCGLIITVDCGITAAKGIEQVVQNDVDVIITDHHEPTDKIPNCLATLNPKLLNNPYPNRELTGVGVAFKFVHAITNHMVSTGKVRAEDIDLKSYLDLVALGTISDMGSLLDENRILVRYGLAQLSETHRVGLHQLLEVCDLGGKNIKVTDVASKIAPRLNSLGRIADPRKGVELLLIRDNKLAHELAIELDLNNTERQKIERKVSHDVDTYIEDNPGILDNKAIVLHSNSWHSGVIPIVTTRISKLYNRPTVMIAIDDGVGKGSIRSIREFPLLQVLKESSDILLNFGGHDFAAGLTIKEKNIPQFRENFLAAANQQLLENDIITKLAIDSKVEFDQINFDFMESLRLLEPYGNENYPPVLYSDVIQSWPPKVVGENHLKLYVEQNGRMLEGIAFQMANRRHILRKKGTPLRIAFTPQLNTFHNKTSIQLRVLDFQVV